MSPEIKILETFEVGQYVIQAHPVWRRVQTHSSNPFGAATVEIEDRSYMARPSKVRGFEYPYVILEDSCRAFLGMNLSCADMRVHRFMLVSPEFVELLTEHDRKP